MKVRHSLHSIIANDNIYTIQHSISAVFTHHYNTLLLNMPVRHMISRLQLGDRAQLAAQLRRIVSLEVRNFFVLAE